MHTERNYKIETMHETYNTLTTNPNSNLASKRFKIYFFLNFNLNKKKPESFSFANYLW